MLTHRSTRAHRSVRAARASVWLSPWLLSIAACASGLDDGSDPSADGWSDVDASPPPLRGSASDASGPVLFPEASPVLSPEAAVAVLLPEASVAFVAPRDPDLTPFEAGEIPANEDDASADRPVNDPAAYDSGASAEPLSPPNAPPDSAGPAIDAASTPSFDASAQGELPSDAAVPDAAVPDAAVPDAAVPDAAVADAAVADVPAADTGASADFGPPDAASLVVVTSPPVVVTSPEPGDVLITEIMASPSGPSPQSEWFEITNTTDVPKLLSGLTLFDDDHSAVAIASDGPVVAPPHAFVLLVRDRAVAVANGLPPGAIVYEYGAAPTTDAGLVLNTAAGLSLWEGDTLLCDVPFGGWGAWVGQTIELAALQGLGSARPSAWCFAQSAWAVGSDDGTPGAANDCP